MAVERLIKDCASKGVLYLEVAGGENGRAALDYIKHYRSGRMLGMDADYEMMNAYHSRGWPRLVIIDREGIVRFHGPPSGMDMPSLRKALDRVAGPVSAQPKRGFVVEGATLYPKFVADAMAAIRDETPRLALCADGEPYVVFRSNREGANNIYVRAQTLAGEPTDEPVTSGDADDYAPDCTFDSTGGLWVVWCSNRLGRYDVYARARKNGRWSPSTRLSESDDDAMCPRIAAGPGGRLAVAYYRWRKMRGVSRDRDLFARVYDPQTRTWSREIAIFADAAGCDDHTDPSVVIDGEGNSWVAWSCDYHPSLYSSPHHVHGPTIFAVKMSADGVPSQPMLVGTEGRAIDLFPSVTCDSKGTVWCLWDAYESRLGKRSVRIARRSGDRFGVPADLAALGLTCCTPHVTPTKQGPLLAAWTERTSGPWVGRIALVSDCRVLTQATLEAEGANVRFPQAHQGADGRIWVVYEECREAGSRVVVKGLHLVGSGASTEWRLRP